MISNSYSNYDRVSSSCHNSLETAQIKEKIYNIGKRVFSYLCRNQQAFAVGLWSYVCIEAAVATSELLQTTPIYDLDSCQNMICEQWHNSIGNQTSASSTFALRCNDSHPNYHPFSLLENCLHDLCKYFTISGQKIQECNYTTNESRIDFDEEKVVFESKIWRTLCPKTHLRHFNTIKEIEIINSCIQNLCNYYRSFDVKLHEVVMKFCEDTNLNKLQNLVSRMSKVIHEAEKKLEHDDSWARTNSIASVAAGMLSIIGSAFAIGMTIITYKAQVRNANIQPIVIALKNIIPTLAETTAAIRAENMQNTAGEPRHIEALDNLLAETQALANDLSEVLEHTISYGESDEVLSGSVEVAIGVGVGGAGVGIGGAGVGIGGAGVVAGGLGITEIDTGLKTFLRSALIPTLENGVSFINAIEEKDQINEPNSGMSRKIFKSIVLPEQAANLPHNIEWGEMLQDYVNDFIFGPFTDTGLTEVQGNRLISSLKEWDNAFCNYERPNILFCRYPHPIHTNETSVFIPSHYTNAIVAKNIPGLCYILLGELWCNWDKFLNLFFQPDHGYPHMSECPSDKFFLSIEPDPIRAVAIGSCYNHTATLRV